MERCEILKRLWTHGNDVRARRSGDAGGSVERPSGKENQCVSLLQELGFVFPPHSGFQQTPKSSIPNRLIVLQHSVLEKSLA